MAERFRFKISRFLSCKSCRLKDPSSLPVDPHRRQAPTKTHRRSSFKHHVSSASSCGIGRRIFSGLDRTETSPTPRFHWECEGEWHVIARVQGEEEEQPRRKICNGRRNDGVLFGGAQDIKRQRVQKKTARRARLVSTSSDDDGEDTENLIPSSRSFSAEYSSSEMQTPRGARRDNKNHHRKPPKRCVSRRRISTSSEAASPAPSAVVEGVAVVTRSEDPYEDFKGSMVEMIVEKRMFDAAELEQLLRCFLTLNSRRHHRAIVAAFSEIWEALFSGARRRSSSVRLSDYD